MIKIPVFLGDKGITSSSANYLASLAQQVVDQEKESLNELQFYSTTMGLIGSKEETDLEVGASYEDLQSIETKLTAIANMSAVSAWLREAVKAKDSLLDQLRFTTIQKYAEDNNIVLPTSPRFPTSVSEQSIIEEMNVKERQEYLSLEAYAATFGKAIHKDGVVNVARKDLLKVVNKPAHKDGTGRDTVVFRHTPTVEISDVESIYQKLQDKYRSYEQRLNAVKFNIRKQAADRTAELLSEFKKLQAEYDNQMKLIEADYNTWKSQEQEKVSKLRIVIPENLQETVAYLNTLGKVSES